MVVVVDARVTPSLVMCVHRTPPLAGRLLASTCAFVEMSYEIMERNGAIVDMYAQLESGPGGGVFPLSSFQSIFTTPLTFVSENYPE